jgi:putative Ca2+/H+ antiporter (TMEM165/GDT1 family)
VDGAAAACEENAMDFKLLATVFGTVFVAELGDKTQLATLLYAADAHSPKLTVFVGSAAALVLTSAIGVAAGSFVSQLVSPQTLSWLAGLGFIAIGIWTMLRHSGSTG